MKLLSDLLAAVGTYPTCVQAKDPVLLTRITGTHGSRLDVWSDPATGEIQRVYHERYVPSLAVPGTGRFEAVLCDPTDLPTVLDQMRSTD